MASGTAVSTLILALQARNDTAAGFAAVRNALREQTEAARVAARTQQEAARQSQARQLLDLRATTAQEMLEMRQKTAFQAQQMQQAAAGQNAAARRAAAERILMLRQDAAQEARIMQESAERQALAIRETTAAQIRASREQVEAVELAARREAEAMRLSQRQQAEAARAATRSERAAARERDGGGGLPFVGGLGKLGGGALRMAGTMALWTIGYEAINLATEAVGRFLGGMVSANAFMENFHQTMSAIYHSDTAATQATDWLTQFALKSPDTREHIFSAAEELAPLGVNLKDTMPALNNVAAIMNVDMPRAAQAFADAFEGRFQMMQTTLHITKGELVKFGMQIDSNGHVLNNSFVPAFQRLAQVRYGEGMANQMKTVTGVFSNVKDAVEQLQRVMGKPMFDLIYKDLNDFFGLLKSPQAIGAAHMLGVGLGNAFHSIGDAVRASGPVVMGAIGFIVGAWNAAAPAIQNAVAFINNVVQRVGAFLHDTVLPVIFQGLAAASRWWHEHAAQVREVALRIFGVLQVFWGSLGANMQAAFSILHGIWMAGWGLLSGGFGLFLDVITGNWHQMWRDLDSMATNLAVGLLEIFKGLTLKLVDVFRHIPNPIDALLRKLDHPAILQFLRLSGHGTLANMVVAASGASQLAHDPHQGAVTRGIVQFYDRMEQDLRAKPGMFTKEPKYDTSITDTTAGKNIFDDWMDKLRALQKSGLNLPGLDWGPGSAPPGTGVDWSGGGGGEPFDPRSANAAQQRLISDAETRFRLDLARGGLTQAQGMRDINAILAAQKAAGASKDQLLLTALQDTQTLDDKLLSVAQKQFDFDAGVAHPNRQKLHQDELAMLKILAQTPGVTPLDVAAARQQWDARITQLTGGGRDRADDALKQFKWDLGVAHPALRTLKRDEAAYLALYAKEKGITPLDVRLMRRDLDRQIAQAIHGGGAPEKVAPYKQAAMALAAGAGYGQTTVTMGLVRDTLVAHLQAQLREMKAQNSKQERQIMLLEAELVEQHRAGGLLEGIFHNTEGTHQATQQTAKHTQPRPTSGAHGFSQRTGVPAPV